MGPLDLFLKDGISRYQSHNADRAFVSCTQLRTLPFQMARACLILCDDKYICQFSDKSKNFSGSKWQVCWLAMLSGHPLVLAIRSIVASPPHNNYLSQTRIQANNFISTWNLE